MSQDSTPGSLSHLDEANALIASIADRDLRAFVQFGLVVVITRRAMDPGLQPHQDFDLKFFVEALRAIGSQRDAVARILRGDGAAMAWWPEGEEPG